MTVLDNEPTNGAGDFEDNKFSVGCHQFLLECCPKMIKIKMQTIKDEG
jgi:hypothetical protein